jgi:hypothetical protein
VQDTVGVDVEGYFDLWRAACCWRDAFQVEFAQAFVAGSDFALTLVDLDGYRWWVGVRVLKPRD